MAHELWDLDLAGEEDLHTLIEGGLPSVLQEVFHTTVEARLEEVLELLGHAELFVSVGEQADIDDGEEVLGLGDAGRAYNNDEVLLCLGAELEGDSLRQLLAYWILDIPGLVSSLAVWDLVNFALPCWFKRERQLEVIEALANVSNIVALCQ